MNNLYEVIKQSQNFLNKRKNILLTQEKAYSFHEIDKFSEKLSYCLRQLGMQPGDRLAVQIEKSEYNLFLYLACLRSGFIYLPLNNSYTAEELDYFFNDARPRIIVCDPSKETVISAIKDANDTLIETLDKNGNGSLMDKLASNNNYENLPVYSSKSDDTAVIIYTSGTTGKPKGAMLTHAGLLCNAQDLIKVWGITEGDTILHSLPLFHVHGLFFALHTALLSGASMILLPKFDIDQFFKYLPKSTVFMGVPTYYTRLLEDMRLNQTSCQNMRLFISGSAPLLPSTFELFQSKTKHTILERYGMTETGINTSNPLSSERRVGKVGMPLPSVNIRIVDNKNTPVSLNQMGEIQIKGKNLFSGYWMKPDKTKESFTNDGYFKTGDLGKRDKDGYLSIVGRSKDIVITGGLNVYPKELEQTIDEIDGVIESAVIGVPHPDYGEGVIAIVDGDKNKLSEERVIQMLRQHHAGYKCPKRVFFTEQIPKNTMGKVKKNILREHFSDVFAHIPKHFPA